MINLLENTVSRTEALKLAPDYVAFVEGNFDKFGVVEKKFSKLAVGEKVLTYSHGVFVFAKVSNITKASEGSIVRVVNGEFSWRVDGNFYAYPVKKGAI